MLQIGDLYYLYTSRWCFPMTNFNNQKAFVVDANKPFVVLDKWHSMESITVKILLLSGDIGALTFHSKTAVENLVKKVE